MPGVAVFFLEDSDDVGIQFGSENGIVKPRLAVFGAENDMNEHLGQ